MGKKDETAKSAAKAPKSELQEALDRIERLENHLLVRMGREQTAELTTKIVALIHEYEFLKEEEYVSALDGARERIQGIMKFRQMTRRLEFSKRYWTTVSDPSDSPTGGA